MAPCVLWQQQRTFQALGAASTSGSRRPGVGLTCCADRSQRQGLPLGGEAMEGGPSHKQSSKLKVHLGSGVAAYTDKCVYVDNICGYPFAATHVTKRTGKPWTKCK